MIRQNFLFLILIFLVQLVACGEDHHSAEDLVESGEFNAADIKDTCMCSELITKDELMVKEEEPFTGVCIENYPESDKKYIEKNILKGQLHGKVSYFDKNGNVLYEEFFEAGGSLRSSKNENQICNCSELVGTKNSQDPTLPQRYNLDNIAFTGTCKEYYPESDQVYMEAQYKNGLKEGYTTFYGKDGSTLYMEKYESGYLIKTVHEQ